MMCQDVIFSLIDRLHEIRDLHEPVLVGRHGVGGDQIAERLHVVLGDRFVDLVLVGDERLFDGGF